MSENLLEVKDLSIHYTVDKSVVKAVNNISFSIKKGEALGLVGETGAGKTTTALGIMRLVPSPPGKIVSGEVYYNGENLFKKSEAEMRKIRGGEISMIFQNPMTALNPVLTVGEQIAEVIQLHSEKKLSKAEALIKATEMMEMVNIEGRRHSEFPHQFSGGMRQRIVIAIALACSPALLLADEPTTALDVTIQEQVLDLIENLRHKLGTSLLLITHDLGVVASICDRIAIMYGGKIVETGSVFDIFEHPQHPYTKGLLSCISNPNELEKKELHPIPGSPPDLLNIQDTCPFADRCASAMKICKLKMPEETAVSESHICSCWLQHPKAQKGGEVQ